MPFRESFNDNPDGSTDEDYDIEFFADGDSPRSFEDALYQFRDDGNEDEQIIQLQALLSNMRNESSRKDVAFTDFNDLDATSKYSVIMMLAMGQSARIIARVIGGINQEAVNIWMRDRAFKDLIDLMSYQLFKATFLKFRRVGLEKSLETIREIADNEAENSALRLSAAKAFVELMLKGDAVINQHEIRVDVIERFRMINARLQALGEKPLPIEGDLGERTRSIESTSH